jgi:hypothetical protein
MLNKKFYKLQYEKYGGNITYQVTLLLEKSRFGLLNYYCRKINK